MYSTAQSDRINALLAQVDEATKKDELQKAADLLREASNLDPQNVSPNQWVERFFAVVSAALRLIEPRRP